MYRFHLLGLLHLGAEILLEISREGKAEGVAGLSGCFTVSHENGVDHFQLSFIYQNPAIGP